MTQERDDFPPKNDSGLGDPQSSTNIIKQFQELFGEMEDFGGFGEEAAQCLRIAETLVRTDNLTVENLSGLIERFRKTGSMASTAVLTERVIEAACKAGTMSSNTLQLIQAAVKTDVDPLYQALGRLNEYHDIIMDNLQRNPRLLAMMLPYLADNNSETSDDNS